MALGAKPTLSVQYCDDPQLTSVSELSEQKLGLVTLTTCRLISAAALRKNTRTQTAARGARGRCRRQKVRRTFTFSSMFSLSLWPRNRSAVGLAALSSSRQPPRATLETPGLAHFRQEDETGKTIGGRYLPFLETK